MVAAAVLRTATGVAPVFGHVTHGGDDGSQCARVQYFFCFDAGAVVVLCQADHEFDAVIGCSCDHVVALFQADGHGFFHQDMFTGIACINGEAMVELVAQGDGDSVDFGVLQEVGVGCIAFGNVVFAHVFAALFLNEVGNGDDFDVVQSFNGIAVRPGNAAQADNANF